MKTFAFALPLAFATLSLAQFEGLPTCAITCANKFLNEGIGNCGRDPGCICADKSFIGAISCCLIDACPADDQQKAINFAQQLCQAQQISVPNVVSCSTSASSPASSTTNTPASTTSDTVSTTVTDSNGSTTTSAASTSNSSSGPLTASTTGSTSSSTSASGNAAGARQTAAPVLGFAGLLAAAALL